LQSTNAEALNKRYEAKKELIKRINECYANENLVECNRLLKLIIDKVYYTRLTEKVTGINPSREGLKVEQGDYIEVHIVSK
jgi:site-specific DNA recombinase